jgi:hypothetical protein
MAAIVVTEGSALEVECPYCHAAVDLNVHTIRWAVWDQTRPTPTLEYALEHECPALAALVQDSS